MSSQAGSKTDPGGRTDGGEGSPSKREEESEMGKRLVLRKWAKLLFSGGPSGEDWAGGSHL